jgi:hypothetical protein
MMTAEATTVMASATAYGGGGDDDDGPTDCRLTHRLTTEIATL